LGPVLFADFEVPERIGFGGRQQLVIHQLPGGGRVIDALGRDDADISWSGFFSGEDAADRARVVDTLRAQGQPLPLIWDAFYYTVLIARFEADYNRLNWVPYKLTCTVLRDDSATLLAPLADLAGSLLGDLNAAAPATSVIATTAALAVSGATSRGTPAYAAATVALAANRTALTSSIASAEGTIGAGPFAPSSRTPPAPQFSANDFNTAADAASALAVSTQALGYVQRASVNLANAST
jgi:hypothetical protein